MVPNILPLFKQSIMSYYKQYHHVQFCSLIFAHIHGNSLDMQLLCQGGERCNFLFSEMDIVIKIFFGSRENLNATFPFSFYFVNNEYWDTESPKSLLDA